MGPGLPLLLDAARMRGANGTFRVHNTSCPTAEPPLMRMKVCPRCGSDRGEVLNCYWLRWARLSVGLTQKALGRLLKIRPRDISAAETGLREPPGALVRFFNEVKEREREGSP